MDDLELLKEQMASLMEDRKHAQEEAFLNSHGAAFNNNREIGLAALNEFQRRGIDTSAVTNEAVESLMNEFRMQIAKLSEDIGMTQQTLNAQQAQQAELLDKVDMMDSAVQSATGNPEMAEAPTPDAMPAPEAPAPEAPVDAAPVDAPVPEEPAPVDAAPVPEAPVDAAPEAPVPEAPVDAPVAEEPAPAPMPNVVSDENEKKIEAMKAYSQRRNDKVLSDKRMKENIQPKGNNNIMRALLGHRW